MIEELVLLLNDGQVPVFNVEIWASYSDVSAIRDCDDRITTTIGSMSVWTMEIAFRLGARWYLRPNFNLGLMKAVTMMNRTGPNQGFNGNAADNPLGVPWQPTLKSLIWSSPIIQWWV